MSIYHLKIEIVRLAVQGHTMHTFVGYDYTSTLTKTYFVIEIHSDGTYGKVRSSKDVIFDQSLNFNASTDTASPNTASPDTASPDTAPPVTAPPVIDLPVHAPLPTAPALGSGE